MAQDPPGADADVNVVTAWSLRVVRGIRTLPADLAVVVAVVILADVVTLAPVIRETPLRLVLGLPFVLFIPGYAFVAALFPEAGEGPVADRGVVTEADGEPVDQTGDRGIDGIERVALSFGLSIAVVPLIGLILNFTPWGIRLMPILASLSAFTLAAVVLAAARRQELPEEDRFTVPYREWAGAGQAELFEPDSRADAGLNVLLVLSILLATSSVGYAVLVPQQGESFSEFYLLTEDGTELEADDYPTEFTMGESRSLVVGVSNQEHEPTNYSVVVQLQQVRIEGNSTTVRRDDQLRAFDLRLAHNETWHRSHTIEPTFAGNDLRLTYFLYRGTPPSNPTVENAYRELHLWVNVSS